MLDKSCEPTAAALDFVERVNRAIDYVIQNLGHPLQLDVVAKVACFSPFHFHRVFKSLLGESLSQFVKRLRLERALALMSHGRKQSLTEIALECGFASPSDFSRSFKQRYGVPPSVFDIDVFRRERREEWLDVVAEPGKKHLLDVLPAGANPDGFQVELRRLPPRRVAYIRVIDSFKPDATPRAAEQLMRWAERAGVADGQWLGYMWDDPEIVAHELCRYDVGVVAPDASADGEVGVFDFPAMTVAQVEVRGGIDLEMRALEWLFRSWLPASGYVPADQPCFEAWIGRPFQHGFEYFELYAHLPVTRGTM